MAEGQVEHPAAEAPRAAPSLRAPTGWWPSNGKRLADVVIAALALVVLSPLLVAVAVAIRLDSRGPVVYRQIRIGRGGEPFGILKFRTMAPGAHPRRAELRDLNQAAGGLFKIRSDPRLTRVGKWLRRFRFDELPQLINVLRGEMSLVGPRPLIPEEDRLIPPSYEARSTVPPGMTGPWQIRQNGRYDLSDLLDFDCRYLRECSPTTDLKVLGQTVIVVLRGRGR